MRNYAPVKICLYNTIICFKLNHEIISLSLKGKTSHQKEKHVPCHNCNLCTNRFQNRKVKGYNLRIIQEYFQPKIAGKNKNIQPGPEKQHSYKNKRGYIKYPSVTDPLKSYSVL